jgi:hypothetical protein
LPQTSPQILLTKINQYRTSASLPAFQTSDTLCAGFSATTVNPANLLASCPECSHATLLSINMFAAPNSLLESLLADNSAKNTLNNRDLTHLCIGAQNDNLLLFFAQKLAAAPKSAPRVRVNATATPTHISEAELWQALTVYRQAQKRSTLNLNEKLCAYARKRVQDHLALMKEKPPEAYPVPDKYPLDGHAGFSADAASGYAFQVTGKNQLAENLAYWPTAKNGTQIIEWGWDTSTEGHRETQLSNDWSDACITGDQGFFVATFGR